MNNKITTLLYTSLIALAITAPLVSAEPYSANHEKVKAHFQSNQEKTTKDAVWTAQNIFKVGVVDDGSRRDGYAAYVCQVLYDYGFKNQKVWVQVIDIVKLTTSGKWVNLGQSRCQ